MHKGKLETLSFLGTFAVVSILLFLILAPFIQVLTLAIVLAALFHAPYEDLANQMGKWKSIAAIIVVGEVLIFIIVPLFLLGLQIFHEAQGLYLSAAQGNGAPYVQTIQAAIVQPVQRVIPGFSFDIGAAIGNTLSFISSNLASIVSQTLYITLETFLMLLAFFFFLRDGRSLLGAIVHASPFGKDETRNILDNMYHTIQSVIRGTLLVALIRWVLIGIGFYAFHIPNAILWGSIGGIVGALPGLGTPFVFIPAIAYLYLGGNGFGAIGLTVYGLAVITIADNILTPYFFGRGLAVPSVFMLFAIIGGILFFGPIGFVLGPLVLSVFLSMFHMYSAVAVEQQT